MPASSWTLEGLRGSARCGGVAVSLDLARPAAGLSISATVPPAAVDHVLGLDLGAACQPSDHWLRGGDITAVYEPADARQLRATAMWRQHACDAAVAAWELIASAQTSLLDSDPAVSVVADVAAAHVRWLATAAPPTRWSTLAPRGAAPDARSRGSDVPDEAAAVLAVRPSGLAVLVAPHPDDAPRLLATWHGDRLHLACRLFTRQLEKGVLLRSRVLAACGPAADTVWAERLIAVFRAAAPPLST